MPQQNLQQFFATKLFEVPEYQRSYSWERSNVRELYEDMLEGLEARSSHYIGTIVLARTTNSQRFLIVDGQQRLTTIMLFISVVISHLKNSGDQDYWIRYYLRTPDQYKLQPLSRDRKFFFDLLLSANKVEPQSKSQRCLQNAHEEITNLMKSSHLEPRDVLEAFGALEILEFIEDNEADAIRIFQTVNDRGKELSRMDKIKSLLYYHSTKYCNGKANHQINMAFAEIFELYDRIKDVGEIENVNAINSNKFSEDDLLRQHHVCISQESYDPTGQWVLDNVKAKLMAFRNGNAPEEMLDFISKYIDSLLLYVQSLAAVTDRIQSDALFFKMFVIQNISTVLYPVLSMLQKKNWLDKKVPKTEFSFSELVEVTDVRIMKVRDYGGRKDIAKLCYELNSDRKSLTQAADALLEFNNHLSDDRFREYIETYDYFRNTGLLRALFFDYCERIQKRAFDAAQLRRAMRSDPTIEHILSQTPDFKPKSFGFRNNEEFEDSMNLLGNLTLLERKINSSVSNANLSAKIEGYSKSRMRMTSELASSIALTLSFRKEQLDRRNKELASDFAARWSVSYRK